MKSIQPENILEALAKPNLGIVQTRKERSPFLLTMLLGIEVNKTEEDVCTEEVLSFHFHFNSVNVCQ